MSRKRKFGSGFQDDVEVVEIETTKTRRKTFQLETALYTKFFSETKETDVTAIYNYEFENCPRYSKMFWYVWDDQILDELGMALPLIKFKKKPEAWRPKPLLSNNENMTIVNAELIYDELLRKLNSQFNQNYFKIPFSEFDVVGWPEGVSYHKSCWSLKFVLKIYQSFDGIEFVAKPKIIKEKDKKILERAFNVYKQLLVKFWTVERGPKSRINKYKFDPWPECVSQAYTNWDEKAIDDIESILPTIEFIPLSPFARKSHSIEASELKSDLLKLIVQIINKKFSINYIKVPWQKLQVSNWPDGIIQRHHTWNLSEILKIYRALPNMEFSLRTQSRKYSKLNASEFQSTFDSDNESETNPQIPLAINDEECLKDFLLGLDPQDGIEFHQLDYQDQ